MSFGSLPTGLYIVWTVTFCCNQCKYVFAFIVDILIFWQDTSDYIAYVAKDPVNRRGKLEIYISCLFFLWETLIIHGLGQIPPYHPTSPSEKYKCRMQLNQRIAFDRAMERLCSNKKQQFVSQAWNKQVLPLVHT